MRTNCEAVHYKREADDEAVGVVLGAWLQDEPESDQQRETVRKQVRRFGFTDAEADQVTDDCLAVR